MTLMGLYKPQIKITMPGIFIGVILGILIMVVYLLIFSLIYLGKNSSDIKKGISVIAIIITLIFLGTIFLTTLFANFGMFNWPNSLFLSLIFSGMISITTWMVYRWDLVFFENREESQTNNSRNMTFNMFNVEDSGGRFIKRDYQKINLAKISLKISFDDNVKISMITIRGDWDLNRDLAFTLMNEFVKRMYKLSYVERGHVAIRLYKTDDDFDSKLILCQNFGFVIELKKNKSDNSYYQLELQSNHRLFKHLGGKV